MANREFRIGAAAVDITPALPVTMGGSFLKFECREVLDPLTAQCVVADDGETAVAVVACDLGTMTRQLALEARREAASRSGIPAAGIHVVCTHNHAAPTTRSGADAPLSEEDPAEAARREKLRGEIVDRIARCVETAAGRRVPARLGYGRGRFEGGAWNRRFIMSNGRSRMHGGGGLERLKPEGPVDREVQAAWFEDLEGRLLAVMVNYSSHVTNLYGKPVISADFPGAMRLALQGVLGAQVPVLYLQGACGNVMCQDLETPGSARGAENARRIGLGLAGETLRIMADNHPAGEVGPVLSAGRTIEIPWRRVPPMPVEEAREKWARYRERRGEFTKLDIEERAAVNSALRLDGLREKTPGEKAEISAFALGDLFFVTNPAELFVEFQLEIKARFPGRRVIVTELTDGWIGYVPTRLACALGGYETIQTRFDPGTGEIIRDASCELLGELAGR